MSTFDEITNIMSKLNIASFPKKLYLLIESQKFKEIIDWSDSGDKFIVFDPLKFTNIILANNGFSKAENYTSFIRQLNMYDFHKEKTNDKNHVFFNKFFIRGKFDILVNIKRKNIDFSKNVIICNLCGTRQIKNIFKIEKNGEEIESSKFYFCCNKKKSEEKKNQQIRLYSGGNIIDCMKNVANKDDIELYKQKLENTKKEEEDKIQYINKYLEYIDEYKSKVKSLLENSVNNTLNIDYNMQGQENLKNCLDSIVQRLIMNGDMKPKMKRGRRIKFKNAINSKSFTSNQSNLTTTSSLTNTTNNNSNKINFKNFINFLNPNGNTLKNGDSDVCMLNKKRNKKDLKKLFNNLTKTVRFIQF